MIRAIPYAVRAGRRYGGRAINYIRGIQKARMTPKTFLPKVGVAAAKDAAIFGGGNFVPRVCSA